MTGCLLDAGTLGKACGAIRLHGSVKPFVYEPPERLFWLLMLAENALFWLGADHSTVETILEILMQGPESCECVCVWLCHNANAISEWSYSREDDDAGQQEKDYLNGST